MIKLPSGIEIKKLIDDLRILSWEASEILIYYEQILKDPNNKSNILENSNIKDPVTLADLKVNEKIIEKINEKYNGVDWEILSEENVKISSVKSDLNSDWIWILDPLDGTKDFIQGTENYAMHLALNYKKKPFLGIVLIPKRNELWISYGEKVWCERRDGSKTELKISRNKIFKEMILVTSQNHRNQTLENLIQKINFKKTLIMGSIGCKISSILRGESDIYICLSLPEKSCPKDWDFAAPEAILKAAGGSITNLNNEELIYNQTNFEQKGLIVASSDKKTHASICKQIKEIIEKDEFLSKSLNLRELQE
tara:strand:- start:1262 stop:2191 length:930 start_codon:yes stop_codon:yes gene_type:complete